MRTSERDCSNISLQNGGCSSSGDRATGVNSDNGNLNFDRWDFTDAIARVTVDVQAKWENYGVFLRPTAFYNLVYANNDMRFRDLSPDGVGQLNYNVDVLDAFVYGNYDIGGHAATIRLGKQALNWGESLFIQGGVNSFQAIDVTAIRTPGAELKDALTPMPMIYASFAATDALTLEAFWQFDYETTELDPAGSFFSTDDIVGKGSLPALSCTALGCDNPDNALADGDIIGLLTGACTTPIALARTKDRGQSDLNQFGVAAHYYADNVGTGTDFGLYFMRFSSRLPYLGFTNGPDDFAASCAVVALYSGGLATCPGGTGLAAAFAYGANQSTYFYEFPTINTLGASFSTTIEGTAVSGEATFSPKMPFGISDAELNASQIDGLGAGDPQYATSFSSGYRAVVSVDYNSAFGTAVNLSPFVQWQHDVLGYSPGPVTANYLKGLKEVSLGVNADYQSRIKGSLSWTSSFGAGWYNAVSDRDFLSASVAYAF